MPSRQYLKVSDVMFALQPVVYLMTSCLPFDQLFTLRPVVYLTTSCLPFDQLFALRPVVCLTTSVRLKIPPQFDLLLVSLQKQFVNNLNYLVSPIRHTIARLRKFII